MHVRSVFALVVLPSVAVLAQEQPPPSPPPITVVSGAAGKNYLNFSLDGLIAAGFSTEPNVPELQTGGHDPAQRGFTVQGVELVLDGAVDPYFRGQANVVFQVDADGETNVELEEAYAVTTSLPKGLQVKVGQYLTEFGRTNPTHPHTWDFVDQPLVSGRMFGGDGLRSVGARLSWLMPTLFYSEIFVSAQNAKGETLTSFGSVEGETMFGRPLAPDDVKSAGDLLYVPRYSASFDVGETQTILVGASGAFGPNGTGAGADTSIAGLDAFWKWKSARANKGFPFVKVQAEAMNRRYDAAATTLLPEETFEDHGGYLQAVWGVKPMWTLGARYDRVGGDVGDDPADLAFQPRERASLEGTWYPTEYSKLRLQYAYDDRTGAKDANSVWLQFEFLLGAHAAHKF
jgi:hypothetical protein